MPKIWWISQFSCQMSAQLESMLVTSKTNKTSIWLTSTVERTDNGSLWHIDIRRLQDDVHLYYLISSGTAQCITICHMSHYLTASYHYLNPRSNWISCRSHQIWHQLWCHFENRNPADAATECNESSDKHYSLRQKAIRWSSNVTIDRTQKDCQQKPKFHHTNFHQNFPARKVIDTNHESHEHKRWQIMKSWSFGESRGHKS